MMPQALVFGLFLYFWTALWSVPAANAAEITPIIDFARDGNGIACAVQYQIPEGYHAYAHDGAETGRPTSLEFRLEGRKPLPVLYPEGALQRDQFDPQSTVSTYKGEVTLLVVLPGDAPGHSYEAELSMLLCSARNCIPVNQTLTGTVPPILQELPESSWRESALSLLRSSGKEYSKQQSGEGSASRPVAAPSPEIASKNMQDSSSTSQAQTDATKLPPPLDFNLRLKPRYAAMDLEIYGLGKALLLGLLAGLILNAMPCVLPVLTFKLSGLLLMGGDDEKKLRLFREHNLCFAAGILTLFTFLALLLGLADLMWGQLYQNQAILLVMLILVFLLGLSMLGVFSLPSFDLKTGAETRNPRLQSYLTGFVSTFLATPCSGPLLGGVLGWAFTQPIYVLVVVFWSVGLGMALPYLLFSIWPALVRILPRPGAWMHVFEHVLGFLLLGTSLYLLSMLPDEKRMQVLSVLLIVAFCAWLWGRYCSLSSPPLRRRLLGLAGIFLLCLAIIWVLKPVGPLPQWRDFSPEYFMDNLGKKPLLLEFTADWCPNCKFLEATVLTDENLRDWEAKYGMELIRVDLTRPNAYAVRLLEMLGSKSIPLTALFPVGTGADSPLVLRDLYSSGDLEQNLDQTFGSDLPQMAAPGL